MEEDESAPSPTRPLRHVSSSALIFTSDSGDAAPLLPPGEAEDAAGGGRKGCVGRAMAWGSAAMVGRRKEMEDAVAVAPEFMAATCEGVGGCAASSGSGSAEISHVRFFGVYDGHGGSQPDREDELHRIENDGGRVINWQGPRVLGVLAMSRSIGDQYMRPWIIPVPEVTFMTRSEDDECLILASDGLWDVVSNGEVGEVARRLLRRHRRNGVGDEVLLSPAQAVANYLVKLAYRKNSSDNISVVVVDFRSGTRHQSLSR